MELVKISLKNVWEIVRLKVTPEQEDFVASNECSLIEAFAAREDGFVALPFGLYENGIAVGFLMLGYGSLGEEDEPEAAEGSYCIWRLMIDEHHQGKGMGARAMEAALAYIRTRPCGKADRCWVSFEPENTAAEKLYERFGFRKNGEMDGDEAVAVLTL